MTRTEFIASEACTSRIHQILEDEVFKEAIRLLMIEGAPKDPIPNQGDLLQQAALNGAKSAGYFLFLERLKGMAILRKPNQKSDDVKSTQWTAMVESLVKSGVYNQKEAEAAATIALSEQNI